MKTLVELRWLKIEMNSTSGFPEMKLQYRIVQTSPVFGGYHQAATSVWEDVPIVNEEDEFK